jgi:hypothetical protein
MEYATEIGSGAMIQIPGFIKIGSGIQKLMGGGGFADSMETSYAYFSKQGTYANKMEKKPVSFFRFSSRKLLRILVFYGMHQNCHRFCLPCL